MRLTIELILFICIIQVYSKHEKNKYVSTDEENAGVLTKKESYQKKKLQKTDISTTKKNNDRFSKESDGENDENDWKSTGKRRKDYFSNDNRDLNVINGKKDRDDNSVKKLKNRGSRMNHKEIDNGVRYKTNKNHDNADELNNTDENDDDYDDRNKVSDESDAEQEEIKSNENVLDDETKTDKEDIFNREMMMHNEKRSRKGKYIRILKEVDKKLMRNDDDSEESIESDESTTGELPDLHCDSSEEECDFF